VNHKENQMKKTAENPALVSWIALNNKLRGANETECRSLLEEELKGRKRRQFVKRIHSRLNKVRADRERVELGTMP
jgi:hypothetical protein